MKTREKLKKFQDIEKLLVLEKKTGQDNRDYTLFSAVKVALKPPTFDEEIVQLEINSKQRRKVMDEPTKKRQLH